MAGAPLTISLVRRRAVRAVRRWGGRSRRALQLGAAAVRLRAVRPSALVRDDGDGGPLLVVVPDQGGFGRYLAEILRAEGIGSFSVTRVSDLSEAVLAGSDLVLIAPCRLDAATVARLADRVSAGAGLVALRPDARLAALLGVQVAPGSVEPGYLQVRPPLGGDGISERAMQVHGPALSLHPAGDAETVADLLDADRRPMGAAVTVRSGTEGRGTTVAVGYDLAQSVVWTRQGNPAWAGQNRDGDLTVRSNDLFYGADPRDPHPDWVDPDLLDLPQADEQQRLLVHLLHLANGGDALGQLWYLPGGLGATVVMTGDDHGGMGTLARFRELATLEPGPWEQAGWGSVRATSYLVPTVPLAPAEATELAERGFELSIHATLHGNRFSAASLHRDLARELRAFRSRFPSLPAPVTHRTHSVPWSDWSSQAEVERVHGIRLDTNYYSYPAPWVGDRPGYFTGSALPMRFARTTGEVIDCYQLVTQLTDESRQTYPATIDTLLDRALGPGGHVAVLTANMHTDLDGSNGSDAIIAAARRRSVPVVSAAQLLTWLDGREASALGPARRAADGLHAALVVDPRARGLVAMVPLAGDDGPPTSVTIGGEATDFWTCSHGGHRYVAVVARSGAVHIALGAAQAQPTAPGGLAEPLVDTIPPVVHATVDDFAAGTFDGTALSGAHGGSVVLEAQSTHEPTTAARERNGAGWTLHARPGGPAGPGDDLLCIRGATLASPQAFHPGCTFEAEVRLSGAPDDTLGFEGDDGLLVGLRSDGSGGLHLVAAGRSVLLPGRWGGEPHRLKVLWQPGLVGVFLDGWPLAEHRIAVAGPLQARVRSDATTGGLELRWARVSPYRTDGSYTSGVIDAGEEVWWGRATLVATAESMTAARLSVRSGPTPTPDDRWCAFVACGPSGAPVAQRGRFLQYRLDLSSCWHVTPEVQEVRLERTTAAP